MRLTLLLVYVKQRLQYIVASLIGIGRKRLPHCQALCVVCQGALCDCLCWLPRFCGRRLLLVFHVAAESCALSLTSPACLCRAAVSRAFSCLSNPQKRAAYDRDGEERTVGAPRQYSAGGGSAFDDFDPEEIFNMFFNGGIPTRCSPLCEPASAQAGLKKGRPFLSCMSSHQLMSESQCSFVVTRDV